MIDASNINIYLDSDNETDDISSNIEDDVEFNQFVSNHSIIVVDIDKPLENIQPEENLIHYTENHFNTRVIKDLNKLHNENDILRNAVISNLDSNIQERYIYSNSPISGSLNGSLDGSISGDSNPNYYNQYGKLSMYQVQKNLEKYYDIENSNKYSSEIDILTTYIKGQKNLYIQSKYLTHRKLNCLMFPTLFLTAAITIIAPFIDCRYWSVGFISGLNAIIALLLSLINYLKLESLTEMYLLMANNYDKLETSLEMTNSKLIFIEKDEDKRNLVLKKIQDVENKIIELKESNGLIIPEEIKRLFPIICHINIFLFIKKLEAYKKSLLIKFRNVKNEMRYILHRLNIQDLKQRDTVEIIKEKHRLSYLYEIKEKLKTEIVEYRSAYGSIDELFTREIKMAEIKKNKYGFGFCIPFFYYNNKPPIVKGMNPIIDKYFDYILVRET